MFDRDSISWDFSKQVGRAIGFGVIRIGKKPRNIFCVYLLIVIIHLLNILIFIFIINFILTKNYIKILNKIYQLNYF